MNMYQLSQLFVAENRIKSLSVAKVVGENFIRTMAIEGIEASDVLFVEFDKVILTDGTEIEI